MGSTPERTAVVCAYHDVGVRCIEALLRHGARIRAVFTHEDAAGENIWFGSVAELARREGIPCTTADVNRSESATLVRDLSPDFLFSFYYRSLIRKEVLEIPRLGALNLHGSYLPKYRGRVPVNWAVIRGETETGATLHYMVEKPDAGDIVDREMVPIAFTDTAFDVFQKITEAAGKVVARSYPLLCEGLAPRMPMDHRAGSYFGGRRPADGLVSWGESARRIYNLVRGVTHPYPGAFSYLEGTKVFLWRARPSEGRGLPGEIVSDIPLLVGTGDGLLEILSLQIEGEPERPAAELAKQLTLRGLRFTGTPEVQEGAA